MLFRSLLVLATALSAILEPADSPQPSPPAVLNVDEGHENFFHFILEPALYFGAGVFFGSATVLSGVSWLFSQVSPWEATRGKEFSISSEIFGTATIYSFVQGVKTSPLFSSYFKRMPSSRSAWDMNKKLLSEIPAQSNEDKELLSFLERHWLAKTTGSFPFHVNWLCPSFGIPFQIHPESTNSYARDPATKRSDTYNNRVMAWKKLLPHPQEYPLILTRPLNVQEHLPACVQMQDGETMPHLFERVAKAMQKSESSVIVDLTSALPSNTDRKQWAAIWRSLDDELVKACEENQVDLKRLLCIQRAEQKDIGGIRLLPLFPTRKEQVDEQYQYLMEWISRFGLTANRIELDRALCSADTSLQTASSFSQSKELASREQWISSLDSIGRKWHSPHPQKTLMFKGTLQLMRGVCSAVSDAKWEEIMNSPTRSAIVHLSYKKIKEQLAHLAQEEETVSFHKVASTIEQIHADFTSLLEIFSPYAPQDFPHVYRSHLASIPQELSPLTNYAIHSSGMTSLGAIFQTVEKSLGRPARILYGENTYFEIINLAERVGHAVSIDEAQELDWKETDLILVQFNPTVRRINFEVTEYQATEYHVEKIAEILYRALKARDDQPLSVALDCTLDYSDSKRVGALLAEFRDQIEEGKLSILCYRSGLKFDLFGMDNYCGAPFFMVNNREEKWSSFDTLLHDPALSADRLSLNWFCLVYEHASSYLEAYRQQIFDNTRAVLSKIPARLMKKDNPYYRVIPMDSDIDPSFIDIKIFGPLHTFRGELLVGIYLTLKCMQAGYPLLYRPGIGFYHPNLAVLFGKECTTVRLTVGLDPEQVDVIVKCLERIDACNGPI